MTTEDLALPTNGQWLGVALISTYTMVHNPNNIPLFFRLGLSSTSSGFKLEPLDTIMVDEAIYVLSPTSTQLKVTVSR